MSYSVWVLVIGYVYIYIYLYKYTIYIYIYLSTYIEDKAPVKKHTQIHQHWFFVRPSYWVKHVDTMIRCWAVGWLSFWEVASPYNVGPPKIAKLVHDCNKQGYGSYSHSELDEAINQQAQQMCVCPNVVQVTEVEQGDIIESLVQHDGVQFQWTITVVWTYYNW